MLMDSETIRESVLKVFYDVLGGPAARAILNYTCLDPEDLVNNPSHLTQSLQLAFGPSAHHLEQAIVRELLRRFNLPHTTLGTLTYEQTLRMIVTKSRIKPKEPDGGSKKAEHV
jgi:hypothetical protein